MKIIGGIYGDPIILNAMKGKSSLNSFSNSSNWGTHYFQNGQNSIEPSKSRLSVIYKKELALNPPKGIPTVEKLEMKDIDTVIEKSPAN